MAYFFRPDCQVQQYGVPRNPAVRRRRKKEFAVCGGIPEGRIEFPDPMGTGSITLTAAVGLQAALRQKPYRSAICIRRITARCR
jgi:hypothetical protein